MAASIVSFGTPGSATIARRTANVMTSAATAISSSATASSGQRVATVVMYLNEPTRGGGTTFPDVHLEVAPKRGNAVFFSYDRPHPATRTLHGGAPVLAGASSRSRVMRGEASVALRPFSGAGRP